MATISQSVKLHEVHPDSGSLAEISEFIHTESHKLPIKGNRERDTVHRYRRILETGKLHNKNFIQRCTDTLRLSGLLQSLLEKDNIRLYEVRNQKEKLIGLGSIVLAQTVIHAEGQETATNLDYYLELSQKENQDLHHNVADELIYANNSISPTDVRSRSSVSTTMHTHEQSDGFRRHERCLSALAVVPVHALNPAIGFGLHEDTREINGAHVLDVTSTDRYDVTHNSAIVNVYTTNK